MNEDKPLYYREKDQPEFRMEPKYICLKLQNQLDVIKLRKLLNELIDGDTAIGLSMKWLDLAEILFKAEGQKNPELYNKYEVKKMIKVSEKYEFTEEMGEISGFGGGYEQCCRDMLKTGLKWFDDHPEADPKFRGYENVYGICISNNDEAKDLEKTILRSVEDSTGAMFQAVISSLFYIKQNGWEIYKEEMSKKK